MVDFTTYQPPGVYVEEELVSVANVVGLRPGVVALVGPAIGYRNGAESITLVATTPVALSKQGINAGSIVVTGQNGTTYVLDTDYTVTQSGVAPATTTEITRVDLAGISSGDTVFVTYQYTDPDYYNPYRVSDFDDVQDAYGPALDIENAAVFSPLSFAAMIAFQNGAREIVCCAVEGDLGGILASALTDAYAKIRGIEDITIVVPLPVDLVSGTTIGTDLETHVNNVLADGNFAIGILGQDQDSEVTPLDMAAAIASPRVILAYPDTLNYYHGYTNSNIEVSGFYLAAAYAGRLISLQPQTPLTRKRIYGFAGFPSAVQQTMTLTQKNEWSQKGVAVTEINRQGQMVVRHGVTTSTTNLQNREISLVRARDALVDLLQETVDGADLVGGFIDEDTPGRVKGVVAGALEAAVNSDVIVGYNDLKVRQLPGDPSVIEVKFQYLPAYPLNYVVISFSINTQTGETTLLDQPQ